MKWNHLKAYCSKKHLSQFSGRWVLEGPRDPQQTKRLCFCHRAIPAEGWQAPGTESGAGTMKWCERNQFLNFSNIAVPSPFLMLTSKQDSGPTRAQKWWWQRCAEAWAGAQWAWAAWSSAWADLPWQEAGSQKGLGRSSQAWWDFVAAC